MHLNPRTGWQQGTGQVWGSPSIALIPPAISGPGSTEHLSTRQQTPSSSGLCLSSLANSSGHEFLAASSARGHRASPEESRSGGKQPGSAGSKAVSGAGRSTAKR